MENGQFRCLELEDFGTPQRRVLWLAWAWWSAVLGYGYLSWLLKGCRAYMPFISDMGLQSHVPVVFTLGAMVEGLLLGFWLWCASIARCHLLKMLRLRFFTLESLCALSGLMVVSGTFFIGFFPWDVYSYLHFACACCVFWGGCFHCFFTALLCQGINCFYPQLGGYRKIYTWLTPLCGLSFLGVFACLFAAWDASPEFFTWFWWPNLQTLAKNDFPGYCSSVSWHGLPWVNSCAFLEWVTLSLLCMSMLAGQADIELYLDLKEGKITLPDQRCEGATGSALSHSLARKWWFLLALGSPALLTTMYITWVVNGCSKVPPFLSHFGLASHTRWLFSSGLLLCDGILAIWLLHIFSVQWALAQNKRGVDVLLCAGFNAAGAILMVCGLAAMSFLSWDQHLTVHLLGICCLVVGFGLWSAANIFLSISDWSSPRTLWWLRGVRFLQYCSWAGSLGALALAGFGLCLQGTHAVVIGDWAFLSQSHQFVSENFRALCDDEMSGLPLPWSWTHIYALCQWMWVGCMHCFVICSIGDSELYFSQVKDAPKARFGKRSWLLLAIGSTGLLRLSYNAS